MRCSDVGLHVRLSVVCNCFQNCEVTSLSRTCQSSPVQCRHVTANYYVNPPWSTPTHRLLPCLPVSPPPPPPGTMPPAIAVYCPMDGTIHRFDRSSPPTLARSFLDDTPAAAYVPMDGYNRVATGSGLPQTGNDVIDDCAAVDDNIYEALNDVSSSEHDDE